MSLYRTLEIGIDGLYTGFLKRRALCELKVGGERPSAEKARSLALQILSEYIRGPISPLTYALNRDVLEYLLNPFSDSVILSYTNDLTYISSKPDGYPKITISIKQVNAILNTILRSLIEEIGENVIDVTNPAFCEIIGTLTMMVLILHELYHEAFKTYDYARKLMLTTFRKMRLNKDLREIMEEKCKNADKIIPLLITNKMQLDEVKEKCIKNLYIFLDACSSLLMNMIHDVYANSLAFYETFRIANEVFQDDVIIMKVIKLLFEFINTNLITVNNIERKIGALRTLSREKREGLKSMISNPFNVNMPEMINLLSEVLASKRLLEIVFDKRMWRFDERRVRKMCIEYLEGAK